MKRQKLIPGTVFHITGYNVRCFMVAMMLLPTLPACSPKIIEHIVVQHDTTKVVQIDSVWQYQRDSVFVKEKGDTVYQYVEHIRYRYHYKVDTLYRVREVHDTTTVEKKVEKELTAGQKTKIGAFWWLVLALAAALVYIFCKTLVNLFRPWLK